MDKNNRWGLKTPWHNFEFCLVNWTSQIGRKEVSITIIQILWEKSRWFLNWQPIKVIVCFVQKRIKRAKISGYCLYAWGLLKQVHVDRINKPRVSNEFPFRSTVIQHIVSACSWPQKPRTNTLNPLIHEYTNSWCYPIIITFTFEYRLPGLPLILVFKIIQ